MVIKGQPSGRGLVAPAGRLFPPKKKSFLISFTTETEDFVKLNVCVVKKICGFIQRNTVTYNAFKYW